MSDDTPRSGLGSHSLTENIVLQSLAIYAFLEQYPAFANTVDSGEFTRSLLEGTHPTYKLQSIDGDYVVTRLVDDSEFKPRFGIVDPEMGKRNAHLEWADELYKPSDAIASLRVGTVFAVAKNFSAIHDIGMPLWEFIGHLVTGTHPVYRLDVNDETAGFPRIIEHHTYRATGLRTQIRTDDKGCT